MKTLAVNKSVSHDYLVLETLEAGLARFRAGEGVVRPLVVEVVAPVLTGFYH